MSTLAPAAASLIERRLDAAAAERFAAIPAGLPAAAWGAGTLPAEWLPLLAWALSVDLWLDRWSTAELRAVVAASADLHSAKGTEAAVRRLLDTLGAVYDYSEPSPFNFQIDIYNATAIQLDTAALRAAIDRVKRASAHYTLTVSVELFGAKDVAGGLGAVVIAPPLTPAGE